MRFNLKYILISMLLTFLIANAEERSSYEGTHFLIGFMQNEIDVQSRIVLQLFITSSSRAKVSVTVPGQLEQIYWINPKQVFHLNLPASVENRQSEINVKNSIEIISDVPISVFAFNSQYTTSDSYSAIPVSYWGNEYVIVSMPNDQYKLQPDPWDLDSSYAIPRSSEFMVIAAYDNTTIEFQPKSITRAGKQTFMKYLQTLNKGDCYQVQSYAASRGYGDLTGTIVRSNKPIGVLSGHVRTAIPQNDWPENSKDHLCEMLMPTNSWGKEFISVPFGTNPDGDLFKLTSIYDNTFVKFRNPYGEQTIVLPTAGSSSSIWDAFVPTVWSSNQPVQIAQFMRHKFGTDPDESYDPCMVILPPVEQFVNRIIFQTLGNTPENPEQYIAHYIYIICEKNALPNLKLDGTLVEETYPMIRLQNIPGTPYYWERIQLTEGVHELISTDGKFSGVIYGTGYADSYGMTLGSSLSNPYKNDSIPPLVVVNEDCGRLSGSVAETIDSINSGIGFVYVEKDSTFNYQWQIDDFSDTSTYIKFTAQPIDPTINGRFLLVVYDKNNNRKEYDYYYFGLDISLPNNIDFGTVNLNDSSCINIPIINSSTDTVRIDSINYTKDPRLKVNISFKLPYYLPPGDTILTEVCYKPVTVPDSLTSYIKVAFECEKFKYIPVYGLSDEPNLVAIGYDFGTVRIGDTVCADVFIVNKGAIPVRLDSLNTVQYSNVFSFDTGSLFPITLNVNDTLKINVCFTPDSLQNYLTLKSASNERSIPNQLSVTGTGAAPLIQSVLVDWGGRRIETVNDTLLKLINTGNYKCNIKFDKFNDNIIAFDSSSFNTINNNLKPGDTLSVSTSFYPGDTLSYYNKMEFKVDWKYHKPVFVELKGYGTIPQMSTIDVVFDTTFVFARHDTVAPVIKSFGNEKLTIDSAKYFSGDSNSFYLDYNLFHNLVINPLSGDTLFPVPIQFTPKRTGTHEMIVEVIHDAAPAFRREKAYFKISGFAVPVDTINPTINADFSGDFYPCIKDSVPVTIKNEGNVNLNLQSFSVQPENIDVEQINSFNFPIVIPPDSSVIIYLSITPQKNKTGRLKISSIFNDTITIEKEFSIIPKKNLINVQDISNLETLPGKTLELEIKGNIEKPTKNFVNFELQLRAKQKNLFLIRENFDILLLNSIGVSKYNAVVTQDSDKITIRSKDKILIDEPCSWSVKIKLYVLLGDDEYYEVKVAASSEPCYEPDTTSFGIDLKNVCIFPLRRVTLVESSLDDVRILPNPVIDDINLTFRMGKDDWIKFTVFDKLGKKCLETENLFLKKGIHSRIFEFSLFADGIYFLTVKNSEMAKNIMFIKYCY